MAAIVVAFTAVMWFTPTTDFVRGLSIGALWTAFIGIVFYLMALSGAVLPRMGGSAEQWTAQALRKLGDRWTVLHDVEFFDSNVDHVAIGPDFVVAIETKWTSYPLDLDDGLDDWAQRALEQAADNAQRIRLLLRSEGVDRRVVPLVVYWGPGASDLPDDVRRFGDVRIVAGPHRSSWVPRLTGSTRGTEPDEAAAQALTRYERRRADFRKQRQSWLRRLLKPA
jgi:hypothetical protein